MEGGLWFLHVTIAMKANILTEHVWNDYMTRQGESIREFRVLFACLFIGGIVID
nr:MAG TPA_asm: hypothetical protein [Caudoviricetes sp.]